jgi:hypothetical protein
MAHETLTLDCEVTDAANVGAFSAEGFHAPIADEIAR